MAQELARAGDRLRSAVDQYVVACTIIQDACRSGGRLNSDPGLMRNLEKESADVASHIRRLEGARAAVDAARSNIPKATHNATLPAEILGRIFILALPGQTCGVQRDHSGVISGIKYPLFPDGLTHVCSFWRGVAIAIPKLWTHIDIALDHSLNPGLFARAQVYAVRAGHFPLDLHISDPGSARESARPHDTHAAHGTLRKSLPEWEDLHDFKFLSSSAAPIKTLEVDLRVYNRFRESYHSMLEYFFARCEPGVLTKYTVRTHSSGWIDSYPFIEAADTPYSQDGALLAVSSLHLDELWLRTPIIRVSSLCPHWTSTAYHGLVELYIDNGVPDISESQLFHILKSSLKLQVFHFKAFLDEVSDDDEIVERVYLEDLREVNLMIRDDNEEICASRILRLITPGSLPLQLCLVETPEGDIVEFFSRANVTRFFIWWPGRLIPALNQCRRLEVLVLNELNAGAPDLSALIDKDGRNYDLEWGTESRSTSGSPLVTRIDTLYLLWHSKLVFEELLAVIKKYSVQKLLIYAGSLSYETSDGSRTTCSNSRNIKAKLSTITTCPIVEYYPDGYNDGYSEDEAFDPDGWIRDAARS